MHFVVCSPQIFPSQSHISAISSLPIRSHLVAPRGPLRYPPPPPPPLAWAGRWTRAASRNLRPLRCLAVFAGGGAEVPSGRGPGQLNGLPLSDFPHPEVALHKSWPLSIFHDPNMRSCPRTQKYDPSPQLILFIRNKL